MLAAMPAAVSENTREWLFGAAHANRRCSERRAVRRQLPSSRKGGRKAWLRPGRRKAGTAGGKRLRNRQAIRERLSGRNRRLTGPGRRKRIRTMNAGSHEPAGMCETVCEARLRPGGTGPMRRASRCKSTHGAMAREVVENASPRLNCPGQPRNGDRPTRPEEQKA